MIGLDREPVLEACLRVPGSALHKYGEETAEPAWHHCCKTGLNQSENLEKYGVTRLFVDLYELSRNGLLSKPESFKKNFLEIC